MSMDKVTVKTSELLEKLKANRDNHAQLYQDAVEGYMVTAGKQLQRALANVNAGKVIGGVSLQTPKDHTEDYDRVIAMLEMSVDDELELTRYEFDNYVLDNWISQEEKNLMRVMALSSSNAGNYQFVVEVLDSHLGQIDVIE